MLGIKSHVLPEGVSDHCPLMIKMEDEEQRPRAAFKYCNALGTHYSFHTLVQKAWDIHILGYNMFKVVQRMKNLKGRLRNLHKKEYHNMIEQVNVARDDLKMAQVQLHAHPMDTNLQQEEKRFRKEFQKISYTTEVMLMQRSKATWLRLGMKTPNTSSP